MNIQRVPTGSLNTSAAGQIQRGAREAERVPAERTAVERPQPARTEDVQAAAPVAAKTISPRLAAYADKIDARLSLAMEARDLSPRQKEALEKAKAHFHGLIQRLDEAYTTGTEAKKKPIASALQGVLDDLVQTFNHVQSGGQIDIRG